MIHHSIRWRLQLWYGLILVVVLTAFGVTAFQVVRARQFRRVDDELRRRATMLAGAFRVPPRGRGPEAAPMDRPPDPLRPPPRQPQTFRPGPPLNEPVAGPLPRAPGDFQLPPRFEMLFDAGDTNSFYFVLWNRDGIELARSSNAPPTESRLPQQAFSPDGNPPPAGDPRRRRMMPEPPPPRMRGNFRELEMGVRPGELLLVGRSMARELGDLERVGWMLAAVGGLILLCGCAGGWWLAGRAIRPIDDISATAVKIAAGDLSQRINVADTENELGRLAAVLNSTFARLEAAFAQQRQFTSDAAHELRTPVSVMLMQTQAALHRERDAASYRETVEACERAAQRMRRLIESLLELARFDAGQEPMNRAPLDLARIAADAVELVRPLAAVRGISLRTGFAAAECAGDAERLGQVITNLLSNAVAYNRDGGEVRVATRRAADLVVLTVADTGSGIAPEHLPHVFERFYRADPSRADAQGRSGLGLAITKAVVEAHGGSIEVSSEPGAGTTFTVRLPA